MYRVKVGNNVVLGNIVTVTMRGTVLLCVSETVLVFYCSTTVRPCSVRQSSIEACTQEAEEQKESLESLI